MAKTIKAFWGQLPSGCEYVCVFLPSSTNANRFFTTKKSHVKSSCYKKLIFIGGYLARPATAVHLFLKKIA